MIFLAELAFKSDRLLVNIFLKGYPPSSFAEAAEDKSGLSSTALARRMILFGAPLSEETMPDTACRARLKRPCPTLRVVLVSKDHARHCVSDSSQKTMPDTACRTRLRCSVRLRRTHTSEKGIVYCFTKSCSLGRGDLSFPIETCILYHKKSFSGMA